MIGKYIFLTNKIGGYFGGPVYIRNKTVWLKEHGWDVVVFDSGGQTKETVLLAELESYKNNHIYELYYHPCYTRKGRRDAIINKMVEDNKNYNKVVVESNTIVLSEWGELIAAKLKARHLVYLIQENLIVRSEEQYHYFKKKSDQNELFSINVQAFKLLFSQFEDVANADNHYWHAGNASPILDIENKKINSLPKADINISHFGRKKDYFSYMVKEVKLFAEKHPQTQINFILLGIENFKANEYDLPCNLIVLPLGKMNPIPSIFYKISDVVIATAGCAFMSFKYGAKVISMDTSGNIPLGVMGFTTIDRTYRSDNNYNNKDLSVLLEESLIEKKYEGKPLMDIPATGRTYDYQISFATPPIAPYYNTLSIGSPKTYREYRDWLFLKMGLVKFRTYLRYWAFRNSK